MTIRLSSILVVVLSLTVELPAAGVLRRPTSLVVTANRVWVANRDSGTISVVARDNHRVLSETFLGGQLMDIATFGSSRWLVAIDARQNEVILARREHDRLRTIDRARVAASPVTIQPLDERRMTIASLWARELSLWSLQEQSSHVRCRREAVLSLPFAPRMQCLTPDRQRLIVADSFGPHLAVVNLGSFQIESLFVIPGHNIRGLAISHDQQKLLVAHQLLNDFLPTTRNHVFWGNVISNLLRSLPLDKLLTPNGAQPTRIHGSLYPLGQERDAAGDPADICISPRGDLLVALAGTGQVALRTGSSRDFQRLPSGRRPVRVVLGPAGHKAYVANLFDDSLSVLDLTRGAVEATIPLGPTSRSLSPAELGEVLFHDARLSLDGWFSCHSCHTDGHSGDLLNDNLGDDSFGSPKRIPSLLGTGVTAPWAWNGEQLNLTDQVRKSLYLTMRGAEGKPLSEEHVLALSAYLQNLAPPPSLAKAMGRRDDTAVRRGHKLFRGHQCDRCHQPPTYTTADTYDVGLRDETDQRQFNPPSLVGVSQRIRFLHDGRAKRLDAVFLVHGHPHSTDWSPREVEDLVAFLETL